MALLMGVYGFQSLVSLSGVHPQAAGEGKMYFSCIIIFKFETMNT